MIDLIRKELQNIPIERVFYKLGFMEGLPEEYEEVVNKSFIKMYRCMEMEKCSETQINLFGMIIFPVIRKVVSVTNIELEEPEKLLDFCEMYYNENFAELQIYGENVKKRGVYVDTEAEFIYMMSEAIIEIIKKGNKEDEQY